MFSSQHQHTQSEDIPPSIAPTPILKKLQQSRASLVLQSAVLVATIAIFNIMFYIMDISNPRISHLEMDFAPWLLLFPAAFIWISNLLMNYNNVRYWQHVESLRFAAFTEDDRLLADKQPVPDATALLLLATITVHFTKAKAIFMPLAGLSGLGAYFLCYNWVRHQPLLSDWSWAAIWGGIIILCSVIFLRMYSTIHVTEEGLSVSPSGNHIQIPWNGIRLFACYRPAGILKARDAIIYEIASENTIIRWTWMQCPHSSWIDLTPTLPFAEHIAQMQALAQLVIAKTGLPLYDLSKGQVHE